MNAGCFAPVHVIAPLNTLVNAAAAGSGGGGQRGNLSTHRGCGAGRAGPGPARPDPRGQPGHDEQLAHRRAARQWHTLRLLRDHRRRQRRQRDAGRPERRPGAHDQHPQHAGGGPGDSPSPFGWSAMACAEAAAARASTGAATASCANTPCWRRPSSPCRASGAPWRPGGWPAAHRDAVAATSCSLPTGRWKSCRPSSRGACCRANGCGSRRRAAAAGGGCAVTGPVRIGSLLLPTDPYLGPGARSRQAARPGAGRVARQYPPAFQHGDRRSAARADRAAPGAGVGRAHHPAPARSRGAPAGSGGAAVGLCR